MSCTDPALGVVVSSFSPHPAGGGIGAHTALGSPPVAGDHARRRRDGGVLKPTIVASDVHKGFGDGRGRTPILKGISLEAAPGESVFLIGPSGSGKTTLLSLLGCILTPDRGSVEVLGQDMALLRPEQRTAFRRHHLGFVFQTFNLFPTLSALDNIRLALSIRGVPHAAARRRAAELLDQVDLSHRAQLRPSRLSTGECQRVAIARALAGDPAVLLADEPTAALDAENGAAVMRLLDGLVRDRGVTLLIVTHDDRIFPYADRILRLNDGRLAPREATVRHETAAVGPSAHRTRHREECLA